MSESKALTIGLQGGMFAPANVGEAIEVAKMIAASGMVPRNYDGNPGAVLVAIQMGAELGLAPMQSIQNIAVINGRPSIWGDAMLGIVVAHKDCEGVDEWNENDVAHCRVKRKGRSMVERSFSIDDAKTAGLWGKGGPWSQYPKRMLQMRARGFALRDAFPDLLRGIQPSEEARDVVDMTAEFAETKPDPLAPGRRSVRKPKPAPEPETKADLPMTAPEKLPDSPPAQVELMPEPEPDPKPTPPAKTAQNESQVFELNPGESELLGMVSKAETMSDIDLMAAETGKRRLRKKAKTIIDDAIAGRRAALQLKGKPEPGADG